MPDHNKAARRQLFQDLIRLLSFIKFLHWKAGHLFFLNQEAVQKRMGVFTWGGGSYTSGKFLDVYPEIEP